MTRTGKFLLLLATTTSLAGLAKAQQLPLTPQGGAGPSQKAPVSFTADAVAYDKTGNIVTATGHVRAIQNGQTLYADKVTLDRTSGKATASGHVALTQPGGNTVYADHAVLSQGMKDAVMQGVSARLGDNARLIANGAQRYNGQIDEMTKVVYSACNLCKTNPRAAPTWQIKADRVTRDLQHKMIEFHGARMEFKGVPVFYAPYLTEADPSVKRQSGLLIPAIGSTSRLGFFTAVPYYLVLDDSSDLTLTPIIASKQGPALRTEYRRAFNQGVLNVIASGGQDRGHFGNVVFANGTFDLNDDWRGGFQYNRASSAQYMDDFTLLPDQSYLTSNVYLEGFSPGAYARIDAETFQGLVASVNQSELPIVYPYGQYHFLSGQDALGGQFHFDASAFNVVRNVGTNTVRAAAEPGYSVPFMLPEGIAGTARMQVIGATYETGKMFEQPNYSTLDSTSTSRGQVYGAVMLRWPWLRSAGGMGAQLIEPEVQFVASPNIGISQNDRIPNEDSLDLEFSDMNLFDFNRYPGIDRLEGGERVDYALHTAWYLPSGASVDGLVGQSYRFHKDNDYLPDSGLTDNVSDFVGHLIVTPAPWFNLAYRTRLSHDDLGARMIDATANVGTHTLNFTGGYLYTNTTPYVLYDSPSPTGQITLNPPSGYFTPRREFTAAMATNFGPWSFTGGMQRNLQTGQFDNISASAGWQNDCFGASLIFNKRYTSYNLDSGDTLVLLQFTFKTLGNVGFNAL
ncbi:MAG TPA: LPS assembly protein LptD [Acidocella sp.]|nr:LPS assembly protein LptD [Acidocella sp.]